MSKIKLGKYKHFKGKEYEIVGIARDSDTLEELVVYRGLYDSPEFGKQPLWVRPQKEFFDKVTRGGKTMPRFQIIQ